MSTPYDAQPPADGAAVPPELAAALARIDELEAKLNAAAATGDAVPALAGPSHDLYLVDGTHVEHAGAIPTLYGLDDGRTLPVAYAVAR